MRVSLPFWLWIAHLVVPYLLGLLTYPTIRLARTLARDKHQRRST